jgi:hypothetical protein
MVICTIFREIIFPVQVRKGMLELKIKDVSICDYVMKQPTKNYGGVPKILIFCKNLFLMIFLDERSTYNPKYWMILGD